MISTKPRAFCSLRALDGESVTMTVTRFSRDPEAAASASGKRTGADFMKFVDALMSFHISVGPSALLRYIIAPVKAMPKTTASGQHETHDDGLECESIGVRERSTTWVLDVRENCVDVMVASPSYKNAQHDVVAAASSVVIMPPALNGRFSAAATSAASRSSSREHREHAAHAITVTLRSMSDDDRLAADGAAAENLPFKAGGMLTTLLAAATTSCCAFLY